MRWVIPLIIVVIVAAGGVFGYQYLSTGQVNVYVKVPSDPLFFTVNSVMIHTSSGSWITISNKTVTFQLSSNLTMIASSRIPAGTYNEIRLYISSATFEEGGTNLTVSVPSNVIKIPIVGGMKLSGGSGESLVITGNPHLIQLGNGGIQIGPVFVAEVMNSSG